MITKELLLPIYDIPYELVLVENINEFTVKHKYGKAIEDAQNSSGFYFNIPEAYRGEIKHFIVFIMSNTHLHTVVHECFHLVYGIFKDLGLSLNKGSEEAYAYALDYIFSDVYEVIEEEYRPSKDFIDNIIKLTSPDENTIAELNELKELPYTSIYNEVHELCVAKELHDTKDKSDIKRINDLLIYCNATSEVVQLLGVMEDDYSQFKELLEAAENKYIQSPSGNN